MDTELGPSALVQGDSCQGLYRHFGIALTSTAFGWGRLPDCPTVGPPGFCDISADTSSNLRLDGGRNHAPHEKSALLRADTCKHPAGEQTMHTPGLIRFAQSYRCSVPQALSRRFRIRLSVGSFRHLSFQLYRRRNRTACDAYRGPQ